MNKSELIEVVTAKVGDRRSASTAVEAVVDAITRAVAKGEKVAITGFGVFEKVDRAARIARNPATGAPVKLKKTSVPKFRPGQGFKDIVSGAKKVSSVSTARAVTARAGSATKSAAKAPVRVAAKKAAPVKTAAKTATKAPVRTAAKAVGVAKSVAAKRPVSKATAAKKAAPAKKAVAAKKAAPAKTAAKAPAKKAARR